MYLNPSEKQKSTMELLFQKIPNEFHFILFFKIFTSVHRTYSPKKYQKSSKKVPEKSNFIYFSHFF